MNTLRSSAALAERLGRFRSWRRSGRRALAVAAVIAMGATATACGSPAADEPASTPDASEPQQTYELTLGLPTEALGFAPFYLADALGFFEQAGVEVDRQNVGSVVTTQLASGQLDVIAIGASSALPIIDQGRPVQIMYGTIYGIVQGLVVTAESPLQTVEDMSGKRLGVLSATGVNAGFAGVINNYLKDQGLEPMEIQVLSDGGAMTGLLESGQVDAVVSAADGVSSQLLSGRYRFLYNGTDPQQDIPGLQKPIVTTSGQALRTTMEEKPEAFARFAAALRAADAWVETATTDEVLDQLLKIPAWNQFERDALKLQWEYYRAGLSPERGGLITEDEWNSSLEVMESFGLGLDLQDPKFSFENAVNMTPIEEAQQLDIEFTPNP